MDTLNTHSSLDWHQANAQVLELSMKRILSYFAEDDENLNTVEQSILALEQAMPKPSALTYIVEHFGLTSEERDALLIVLATDLKSAYAVVVAEHPLAVAGRATTGLLRAVLQCDFSLFSADSILRRARLISLSSSSPSGTGVTDRVMTVDEPVFQFLTGHKQFSADINALSDIVPVTQDEVSSVPGCLAVSFTRGYTTGLNPVFAISGNGFLEAANDLAPLGLQVRHLSAHFIPEEHPQLIDWAERLDRDLILNSSVLGLSCNNDEAETKAAIKLASLMTSQVLISDGKHFSESRRTVVPVSLNEAAGDELAHWTALLGEDFEAHQADVDAVISHFTLSKTQMKQAATTVRVGVESSLWNAVKVEARVPLEGLAERIEPQAEWTDLVLPDSQMAVLKQMTSFLSCRQNVFNDWGFRAKSKRGLGLAALFSGPSGTGKTMAAEVVARAFGPVGDRCSLDLFRVDLSVIISKYIGETEKNLARIFDAAESSGAILLFDESEALFSARTSQVRSSLDRHANTETAYLLQRLEAYSGIAILTTNLKSAIDEAFLRRFRFVMTFPFPDAVQREKIWRKIFPQQTPLGDIDYKGLSRLALAGGHIRSIALNAAFLGASENSCIEMHHLRTAARQEYAKLDKPLTEAEMGRLQ